jgi:hypothetical protein
LLTKLLANRLQSKILDLVHANQYGFLQTRNIQDCVGWAYEYIHQCKQAGTPSVILKLDFAKAFDTVEHIAILKVFESWGFDPRWMKWLTMIMLSGTSEVLLNGVPGKKFPCRRGVRQGDPLSPCCMLLPLNCYKLWSTDCILKGSSRRLFPSQTLISRSFNMLTTLYL